MSVDPLRHNRHAWNQRAREGDEWTTPVSPQVIADARAGRWQVVLTPQRAVPLEWFGTLRGAQVLCLASGGGQQAPVLAAAGASVVSFDLSEEQLATDRRVAERDGLDVTCVQGDMADLSCFADGRFDLVFHPVSNLFVPDVRPVWRECHRVLRRGGVLLAGFMNPALFMFDHDEADAGGALVVKYALPYSDLGSLPPEALARQLERGEAVTYGHCLAAQIGGQLDAGFLLSGMYEDQHFDEAWRFNRFSPVAIATRALKP